MGTRHCRRPRFLRGGRLAASCLRLAAHRGLCDAPWSPRPASPGPQGLGHLVGPVDGAAAARSPGSDWAPALVRRPRSAARLDRYTYWEKFDYWAVFWGMGIIGASGLFLWFPVFFSRFLPGWIFNVALLIHGEEALLAVGFIFTMHFFNGHLRPEVPDGSGHLHGPGVAGRTRRGAS